MEDELRTLAEGLAKTSSVEGVVIVGRDGTVVADSLVDDAEKEGAVAVFIGSAADIIGDTLALGTFDWGVVTMSNYKMLIIERPLFFIGLLLSAKASPTLLAAQVQGWLGPSA